MAQRILIVDDNKMNSSLLRWILGNDYEVLEAADGQSALEILRRESGKIAAVMLDLIMPGMDGYETLRHIREDSALSAMPVIVMTGEDNHASELKALSLGANDYVTKPYDAEVIRHRLHNTLHLLENAVAASVGGLDRLTGLYDREAFFSVAEKLIGSHEAGHYIMACFDIDGFKFINDQYGTEQGDLVLQHIARIFRQGFEPMGGVCCRVASDHFAVLYPASFLDTEQLAAIREAAARPVAAVGPVSFSIGRYLADDLSLPVSAMYDRAALAEASVKGRFDTHVARYDESMRKRVLRQQEITNDMNIALADGQFEVWLQPQYNHMSGALIGAEALVRWLHPKYGIMSPAEFIPVFERSGFIFEMDKYVWEQTCRLQRQWLDEGLPALPVSVNISRYDIFRCDLVEEVAALTKKYGLPPELLRLEITESAFARPAELIIRVVERLLDKGFLVEIDDFGSGYSSLNTLKDVPAHILKLDMRFLEASDNNTRGGSILESVVRMAKWLGMPVIAEGVETRQQADYLKSIGCVYVQGYLYARPMPAQEYRKLLAQSDTDTALALRGSVSTMDGDAFWDPDSMQTLIFNSYVGAACIFEYCEGRMELLRANQKYTQELLGEDARPDVAQNLQIAQYMDEETLAALRKAMEQAVKTGRETVYEAALHGLPGRSETVTMRVSLRAIAAAGDRYLVYGSILDVTAEKTALEQMADTTRQLSFLNELSKSMLAGIDAHEAIMRVLERVLDYFSGRRAYVIEFAAGGDAADNRYEVCAPGVKTMCDAVPGASAALVRDWLQAFSDSDCLRIDGTPAGDGLEKARSLLTVRDAGSMVAVTLRRGEKLIGFMGVDDPGARASHADRMRAMGDYMSALLTRRDMSDQIRQDSEALRRLMNDTPGGFSRMKLQPNGALRTVFVNDRFCELRGMNRQELQELEDGDLMRAVFPQDVPAVQRKIQLLLSDGSADKQSLNCRLRNRSGGYDWFSILCRVTTDSRGEQSLNAYFNRLSDAETQTLLQESMLPATLSAMLRASTDIVFVKDASLRYVFCSQAFADAAGLRDTDAAVGKTDFDLAPEDLAREYRRTDRTLLDSGQPVLNITATLPDRDGAPRYARMSKYALTDSEGRVVGVYGIGQDVTAVRDAFTQIKLLIDKTPCALATYELDENSVRLLYLAGSNAKLTGYTTEEFTELTKNDTLFIVAPEDVPPLREKLRGLLLGKEHIDVYYRLQVKNNGLRWVNLRGVVTERRRSSVIVNTVQMDVTEQKLFEQSLRIREEEYQLAIANSGSLLYRYSHADNAIDMPENSAALFGLPTYLTGLPESVLEMGVIAPESKDAFIEFFAAMRRGDKTGSMTVHRRISDGRFHWFSVRFSNIFGDDGKPSSAIVMFEDITGRRERELAYVRLSQMDSDAEAASISFEADITAGTIEKLNGGLLDAAFPDTGCAIDDYLDYALATYLPVSEHRQARAFFSPAFQKARYEAGERTLSMEWPALIPGQLPRWVQSVTQLVEDPYSGHLRAYTVLRDVTAEKREQLDVRRQAENDGMTGLYNKVTAEKQIRRRLERDDGVRCALLVADLDELKSINDAMGHDQGDRAIRLMASALRAQFRQTDVVGRIGGDEFIVFLDGCGDEQTLRAQLTAFFRRLSVLRVDRRPLRCSLGAVLGRAGDDYAVLFRRADRALYQVKRGGKDGWAIYSEEMENSGLRGDTVTGKTASLAFEGDERELLLQAMSTLCPMMISVNLTQNTFLRSLSAGYWPAVCPESGDYDDLIAAVTYTMHGEDQASFTAAMSRESLLAARARGETVISHDGMQMSPQGEWRHTRTQAVFVHSRKTEDAMAVMLVRFPDTEQSI